MVVAGPRLMAGIDSITYGVLDAAVIAKGSYRFYLNNLLKAWWKADPLWCGDNFAFGQATVGNKMIGTSGLRIDEVLGATYGPAAQFADWYPDVHEFHGGTNDCTQLNTGTWVGGSVAISIANLSTYMDLYRAAVPTGIFVLSLIIPNTNAGAETIIQQWNTAAQAMALARSDAAYIVIADCHTAFTNNATWSTDYMADATHPNDLGASIMATAMFNAMQAAITLPKRGIQRRRRRIKPHTYALRYTASSATTLGSATTLDSTKSWAVMWEFDMSRSANSAAATNGMWSFKTDQATPFSVGSLGTVNNRGLEIGSSANFNRFFPLSTVNPGLNGRFAKGKNQLTLIFDGVNRTLASSYKLVLNGVKVSLVSGAGLAGTTNANAIGQAIFGGVAGTFDMYDMKVWVDGTVMTIRQAADLFFDHTLPVGPTLIRNWDHSDGSGSTLTDKTGNQNGTIVGATWVTNGDVPTKTRTLASARTLASVRSLAS